MGRIKSIFGVGTVFVVLLLGMSIGFSGCDLFDDDIENPDNNETTDSVVDDLQGMIVLCNSPNSGLDPSIRGSLVDKINRAKTAYLSAQLCLTIPILNEYLQEVQTLRSTANEFQKLFQKGQAAISGIELKYNCETPIPQ